MVTYYLSPEMISLESVCETALSASVNVGFEDGTLSAGTDYSDEEWV